MEVTDTAIINITQATMEVPGQTPPTFTAKRVGLKSVKY